jgi:DNA-binding CsgD family transcriptional regulator
MRDTSAIDLLDPRVRRRVAELEASLLTLDGGDRPWLEAFGQRLVELFGAERAGGYGLRSEGSHARVDFFHGAGSDMAGCRSDFDEVLREDPLRATLYNPLRPEPSQRNRAISLRVKDIERTLEKQPGMALLARRHPFLLREDQLRVLVCEDGTLLAWVGVLRAEPYGARDREVLQALVPALRQRLVVERQLAAAPLALGTLAASIEAAGVAALLVRAPGTVVHANAAGRAFLDAAPGRALERIHASPPGTFTWTRVSVPGLPPHWLVTGRRPPADPAPRLAALAREARLSPRQAEVLAHLVRGDSNQTTALALGVSEGAVELHVSALLARLDVESRAALVARFWSSGAP